MPSASPTPAQVFGGAGQPNIKKASERYSTKRAQGVHVKTGEPVLRGGQPVEMPSEREHAFIGAWMKGIIARNHPGVCMLNEHDQELLKEMSHDHLWVGEAGGMYHRGGVKLADALRVKATDFIATSTSGGDSLVPFYFDDDLYKKPLLSGELFPFVDVRELPSSNAVHTQTLGNLTANWSASEGSGSAISLQTTDSLVSSITPAAYNMSLAITIGRDLLADTPVALGQEVMSQMGSRHAAELDKVIATGDGTTQPQGLTNASGTNTVTAANSTAGPLTVADLEKMISSLPKQYRQKNDPSVCWVMADSAWFRIRGLSVSSSDQRRIFGYNHEDYTLFNRRVCISNDIPANDLFFGRLALYRMWRRQGLQIETSTEGKTLRTQNELLITARGRYAGQFIDGAGLSFMSDASLHS